MKLSTRFSVLAFSLGLARAAIVVPRQYGGYGYGGGGDDGYGDSSPPSTTSIAPAPAAPNSSPNVVSTSASATMTGDTHCVDLLCVSAIVNSNSTITYIMQSTGQSPLGWMAIGFGSQMANTPMVIMWPNAADGSIWLSQRQATGHVEPSAVAAPARVASSLDSLSVATSGTQNPKLAFTIAADSNTQPSLIWAFGSSAPTGSSPDTAQLTQHLESGTFQLNLANKAASFNPAVVTTTAANSTTPASSSSSAPPPLTSNQTLFLAHAILSTIGFIVLLPTGVLVARYLRVITPTWFKGHAYTQFWISGPVIILGFILAVAGVGKAGSGHFNDKHKLLGLVLVIAYAAQSSLGALIHWIKDPARKRRPAQNYAHAVFGLSIIGLAFYQVRLGYKVEWMEATGRTDIPGSVNTIWVLWVILLTLGYTAGLALLKKQFAQEKASLQRSKITSY